MWKERRMHAARARVSSVRMKAMRADALERVLAVLDRVPDDVTVRELRPTIEDCADQETILLLRRTLARTRSYRRSGPRIPWAWALRMHGYGQGAGGG